MMMNENTKKEEFVSLDLRVLPYWNLIRIAKIIEDRVLNIDSTEYLLRLTHEIPNPDIIKNEILKRLKNLYSISLAILSIYGREKEILKDYKEIMSIPNIDEILPRISYYTTKILTELYQLMKDLGLLPKERERDELEELEDFLSTKLYEEDGTTGETTNR